MVYPEARNTEKSKIPDRLSPISNSMDNRYKMARCPVIEQNAPCSANQRAERKVGGQGKDREQQKRRVRQII